jgi:hypothetical protein
VVAKSAINSFKVVKEVTKISLETFKDILSSGSQEKILDFLRTMNLLKGEKGFSFNDILWLLKDKAFYTECMKILKQRKIFDSKVYSFGLHH